VEIVTVFVKFTVRR